jgi:uncharacterized coiled-coil DUF342 family protein
VTPVQKVIELLKKLSTQVEADGKKEAAQYDKFSCFCKEQADEKLYAIEKSAAKIEELDAEIADLGALIASLAEDIGKLGKRIARIEGRVKKITSAREEEHASYVEKEADVSNAISALKRAIAAMKDSKGQLEGKVDLDLLERTMVRFSISTAKLATLRNAKPGEAFQYEYHSNDIIATLENVLDTFTETKNRLDTEEFEANSAFEKKRLDLENNKKFAEEDKLAKEKLSAAKTERKEEASAELAEEEGDKEADESFMRVLQKKCEDTANEWDKRSVTRSSELTSIAKALEALETGVVPNWGANKKLVGLQKKQTVKVRATPSSFLQLRGSSLAKEERLREQILKALDNHHSPMLTALSLKVRVAEDHFVKVRSIIKDLVAKLAAQAEAEKTQKSFCDEQMKKTIAARDEEQGKLEGIEADITEKTAERKQLKMEIAELAEEIASAMKALSEATELRVDEKADNDQTVKEAGAGKEQVEFALKVLKDFYDGAFVQTGKYVPPDSDRSGKTVGDLAPEIFDAGYHGRQDSSSGILGLLEVILSDFDRTEVTVTDQEKTAAEKFDDFKKATEDDIKAKKGDKEKKEAKVVSLTDDLTGLEDDKKTASEALANAKDQLETLSKSCVEGEETYEERVANRQKEIEALKKAQQILEDWKN